MSTAPTGFVDPKTGWKSADVVLPDDLNRIEGNINAIELGNRTLDPTQAPTGNVGTLRQLLDWIVNRIKAITGKTNWYDAPDLTLGQVAGKFDASAGHAHSGAAGDAPPVPWANVSGKPTTYPPSAHASTHKSGGADPLTPGDIGAAVQSHDHDGTDAPYVPWANVSGKPTTFPPSAHKSTHASGGSDALTPADIGAARSAHGSAVFSRGGTRTFFTLGWQPRAVIVVDDYYQTYIRISGADYDVYHQTGGSPPHRASNLIAISTTGFSYYAPSARIIYWLAIG